ncbi:50S ribosomal protein L29 [Vampirovibrio chlorellavorus]|uniref:50S ribosomal protein L29 n=1 Tax=Vampirovibrio chlorellavorus TaxID=758823 RepID=UPI0026F2A0C1|nr:50S ribosomal protein L29 [Vampirovibrio chlorellavorus]
MKITEMRELTQDELNTHIEKARKALFEARFKHSMNQLESTAELRQLRHQIAQLQTVLTQKAQQV